MKGVEVGNIFKLGTRYSDAFKVRVNGPDGNLQQVEMGCYGIGTTRMIASLVELLHDENGIIWPKSVAPYLVHLVSVGNDDEVVKKCEELYENLQGEGFEVLYDDRDERPGVKFTDADLIGIPVRIVVSRRTLENNELEWKLRAETEAENIGFDKVVSRLNNLE